MPIRLTSASFATREILREKRLGKKHTQAVRDKIRARVLAKIAERRKAGEAIAPVSIPRPCAESSQSPTVPVFHQGFLVARYARSSAYRAVKTGAAKWMDAERTKIRMLEIRSWRIAVGAAGHVGAQFK